MFQFHVCMFVSFACLTIIDARALLQTLRGAKENTYVSVWQLGVDHARVERSVGDTCTFTGFLRFMLAMNGSDVILNLERSTRLASNAPVYAMVDGRLQRKQHQSDKKVGVYQDRNRGSAILVSCTQDGAFNLHGSFYHGGIKYTISADKATTVDEVLHFVQKQNNTGMPFVNDGSHPLTGDTFFPSYVHGAMSGGGRYRREISDRVVELLMVVDTTVYDRFLSENGGDEAATIDALVQYFTQLTNEMDLVYSSMPTPISLSMSGIYIEEEEYTLWSASNIVHLSGETYLNMDGVQPLVELASWNSEVNELPPHDHAMAFTLLDLATISMATGTVETSEAGRAYIATVCTTNGVSIVEMRGTGDAAVAAHELAHSLGVADHDGEGDATECPADEQYLMGPTRTSTTTSEYAEAQWTLSTCSIDQIEEHIASLGTDNCLLTDNFTPEQYDEQMAASLPGTDTSLDEQCQFFTGLSGSTACATSPINEEQCYSGITCSNAADECVPSADTVMYVLSGTPCTDNTLWCIRGQCMVIPETTTPSVSTTTLSDASTSVDTTVTSIETTSPAFETTSTTVETTSTFTLTTTTPEPCTADRECCVWRNSKRKCCTGAACCEKNWASDTRCYKTCCGTVATEATTPTIQTTESSTISTESTSVTTESTTVTTESTTIPTESTTSVTTESTTIPTESTTSVTTESTTIPTESTTAVTTESTTIPTESTSVTTESTTAVPTESTSVTTESSTLPTESTTAVTEPSTVPTESTTETTTTPEPCTADRECCVWRNSKRKCCTGAACCDKNWASDTRCYKTCCGTESTTSVSTAASTPSTSTPSETTSTPAETTSTPAETTSTPAETTSTPAETTSTTTETTSTTTETTSSTTETTSTTTETTSTSAETTTVSAMTSTAQSCSAGNCCVMTFEGLQCCQGVACCDLDWATGTPCKQTCCGATTTTPTSASSLTSTTSNPAETTTTTQPPCIAGNCCVMTFEGLQCCQGDACCGQSWASETDCAQTCCGATATTSTSSPDETSTTQPPCMAGNCCVRTFEGLQCCQGDACCGQSWASATDCAQTCCGATTTTPTSASSPDETSTSSATTTTQPPCMAGNCCVRTFEGLQCCQGDACCGQSWASETDCAQTCCGATTTTSTTTSSPDETASPTTANTQQTCSSTTCCEGTFEGLKCCTGTGCCGQNWASGTDCAQTCC